MRKLLLGFSILLFTTTAVAEIFDGLGSAHKGQQKAAAPAKPQMPEEMAAPDGPTQQGTVLDVIQVSGFTYLQLQVGSKQLWIAGTTIEVAKGKQVEFVENVAMQNFFSKSLNRTFDLIIFASSVRAI